MDKKEFNIIIQTLEKNYVREIGFMKDVQYQDYFNGLYSNFKNNDFTIFKKAIDKYIRFGKNLPVAPDLIEILNGIQRDEKLGQQKERVKCDICNENGVISYYRFSDLGYWAEYVSKCVCKNADKYNTTKMPLITEIEERMKEDKYIRFKVDSENYNTHPDDFRAAKPQKKEYEGMSAKQIISEVQNKIINKGMR